MSQSVDELTILDTEERGAVIEEILEQLRRKGTKLPTHNSLWLKESYTHELRLCKILMQYQHDEEGGGSPKTTIYITEKFGRPNHVQFLKDREVAGYTATYTGSKEKGLESIGLNSIELNPYNDGDASFSIPFDDKEREHFDALLQYIKIKLERTPEPSK